MSVKCNTERKIAREKRRIGLNDQLRERFKSILLREPYSIQGLSKRIKVARQTIESFIEGDRSTYMKSLLLIERWIDQEETRLEI
jgi:hypothetical protein